MASLSAIINGTTYSLSDGNPFHRVWLDGAGMPDIRRITERGPMQQGATDVDYRIEPRKLSLGLFAYGASGAAFDGIRDLFYAMFAPANGVINLVYTRDDAAVRQIDVHVSGAADLPQSEQIGDSLRWLVPLEAADPLWYDPTPVTAQITQSPLNLTVAYTGDAPTFPVITFTGPLQSPILTNTTTGDKLDFTGYNLAGAASIVVNLAYGYKTVLSGVGVNMIAYLTNDSDLATWALQPGDNALTLAAGGLTGASLVSIAYYRRYVGA
jgi:hypothetical protein